MFLKKKDNFGPQTLTARSFVAPLLIMVAAKAMMEGKGTHSQIQQNVGSCYRKIYRATD